MDPGSYDLKLPQPCIRTPKRFLLSFFGAGLNLSPPPGFGYSISTASDIVRTIAITKNVESCKACDFAGVGSILEIAFAIGVSSEGDKVVPTDDILARTVKTTSPVITAGQVLHEAVLPLLRAIFGQSYRSVGGLGVQLLLFGESSETELIYTPNSLNRLIPALSKGIIKGDISFLADMLPMCAVCCCTISGFTVGIALYKGFWNVQPLSRERPMERPILRTFSSSA
jgi:hypothetical protein